MGRHPRLLLLSAQVGKQVGQSFYGEGLVTLSNAEEVE